MKKILTNNIGVKLLSLLFAIVLWIIIVNVDDPKVTRTIQGIPVTILDENVITDNNQVYEVISGKEVTVTVKGPRSMVDKMTRDYFYAYAPFSEKSNVDAVPVYVEFRNSKYDKDCEITLKTMTMRLGIERVVEKNFEIGIVHSSELSSAYYLGRESISTENVTIRGRESVINQIHSVNAKVDLSGRTQDFQVTVDLKCYTDSGNEVEIGSDLSLSVTSVDYAASIYQVREIPLKYGYTGTPASGYEVVEVSSDKVTIKVAGPYASRIENISIPNEVLNVSDATENITIETDISTLLPDGVNLVTDSDSIVKLTAKVEGLVTNTYRLPVSAIDKNNIPSGYNAEIVERNVNISIVGLEKNSSGFSVNDIKPYVDLRNTVEGNNEVLVKFDLPEGLKLIDDVKVNVYLTRIEETTITIPHESTTTYEETDTRNTEITQTTQTTQTESVSTED